MENVATIHNGPAAGKAVTLKFLHGRPSEVLVLQPGATSGEMLSQVGLGNGYQLSSGKDNLVFGWDEVVYGQLQDGDLVYVGSLVDAGH